MCLCVFVPFVCVCVFYWITLLQVCFPKLFSSRRKGGWSLKQQACRSALVTGIQVSLMVRDVITGCEWWHLSIQTCFTKFRPGIPKSLSPNSLLVFLHSDDTETHCIWCSTDQQHHQLQAPKWQYNLYKTAPTKPEQLNLCDRGGGGGGGLCSGGNRRLFVFYRVPTTQLWGQKTKKQ